MKINVRQKDIDNGIGGDGNECPIALATRRAFNTQNVEVFYNDSGDEDDVRPTSLRIKVGDEYYSDKHIDKYEHCDNFIHWFDDGIVGKDGCEPFKFNIDTSKISSCYE